jgi:2-oxo-hept-3-ene-1,7-dioate hydratase
VLSDEIIEQLALKLDEAEREREPIEHFTKSYPDMTIADAYAIQRRWVQMKLSRGARQIGRKIGLTSRPMQRGAGISEPDYGVLLDYMGYEAGSVLPSDSFLAPRVEVELCFVLDRQLRGPGVSVFDVLSATGWVVPALEVVDTRFHRFDPSTNLPRRIQDTISDNAANGAVVIGARPVRVGEFDLRRVGAVLYRNEVAEESGVSATVMDHPARAVAWLANAIATYGDTLEPGELILAGSFTSAIPVLKGDVIFADYGELGTISCRFN